MNTKPTLLGDYPDNVRIGTLDGKPVYLRKPTWDCDWYWGVGYVGNDDLHTHLFSGLYSDDIKLDYGNDVWVLKELMTTIRNLKTTAEVFGRGGSHVTTNPCKDDLLNPELVKHINYVLIPLLIDEMYKVLL